ncbi:MAG: winged helix-turn-helix transcriptional regulator [Microcoleaceae cyanobacterium]
MRKQRHESYTHCPVEAALDLVGGKWKSIILFRLREGTKRFNQLQRLIPHVTRRMLTLQLRELEADGLVSRKVYQEVPPKVEYSITELGLTLTPLLLELKKWGETYAPHYMQESTSIPVSAETQERD